MSDQIPDMDQPPKAHVVSHTHWDREWRWPLWHTRLLLLDFMDQLIPLLENGTYPAFVLDGQVIPVLDYLEIRPEMETRVKTLVQAGKLLIGPWLLLPDEYPIDAEALVRNLLQGRRAAETLGAVFNVGYTSFGWGQTAQLPQIYAGFGIDVAFVGKQVSKSRAPQCEFLWRAPDGTEMLTSRFGKTGRANFYFKAHLQMLVGIDYETPDWLYHWPQGQTPYHRADPARHEQEHQLLDPPTSWHPPAVTKKMLDKTWATMDESVLHADRLMMNGSDFAAAQPLFADMLAKINQVDTGRTWLHTSLADYVNLMRQKIDRGKLTVVQGELRDGPAGSLTGNALSTRLDLKQHNKLAENLLIRFAEPLTAWATMTGAQHPAALLDRAWQFLLEAHPHDSINGCTQDKTGRDVTGRLDQVVELAHALADRAMQHLIRHIDLTRFDPADVLLVVFNPLPYPRREVLQACVDMPDNSPRNRNWRPYAPSEALTVYDTTGRPVPTQWQGLATEVVPVAQLHSRALPFNCLRHRLLFDTGTLPAGGYKVFKVGPGAPVGQKQIPANDEAARTDTLLKAPNVLENELLRVVMNPNGAFDLTAKALQHTFPNLNYYEDRGEIGDFWTNYRPMHDQIHSSIGCPARIWAQDAGPLHATLVSEVTLRLPQRANKPEQRRGKALQDLTIQTAVTLRAGSEQLDVTVTFDNRCEDHYLRAMFPTHLTAATEAAAGGHFTVDVRPIRPQGPHEHAVWPEMATLPQQRFLDLSDGHVGLAFLNDCLTEYEVLDNPQRTVALSLLRAVRTWICTETRVGSDFPSQKDAQMVGQHEFHYALRPHAGDWLSANIPLAADQFNTACPIVQTRQSPGALPADACSLFQIDNTHLRFSALKHAADRPTWIVRLYNPTSEPQTASLRLAQPIRCAYLTNLNEDRTETLNPRDNSVTVKAPPHKILTIECELTENVARASCP